MLSDWLIPLHPEGADWRRTHILAHLIGGMVWWGILHLPPLHLTPGQMLLWVGVIQGVWERYQREYDPTYPYWSIAWDTLFGLAGAAVAIQVERLVR